MSLENIQSISVSTDSTTYKSVIAKQYDNNSRMIQLQCTSNNQPLNLRGYSINLNVLNPKKELYVIDGDDISYKDDYTVLIKLNKNVLGEKGKSKAQFIITSGTTKLSSLTFYIITEEDISEAIGGSEKYSILDSLILRVEQIDVKSEQYMNTTKSYMNTTKGYLDTTLQYKNEASASKDRAVTAETNAKTSATNAETSETNALNSANLAKRWAVKSNNTNQPSDTNNAQYWAETLTDRWVEKADQTTVNGCINSIVMDDNTGIFTITFVNGSTKTIDTKLEKIAINFDYDEDAEKIIITLDDGATKEIDLSSLISEYNFQNSSTISFSLVGTSNKNVKAEVIEGSITDKHLQPNYLADITVQANNAERSAIAAKTSETNASNSATSASSSASIAMTRATEAGSSASTASTKALEASVSAQNAKSYMDTTLVYKNEAEGFKDSTKSASLLAEDSKNNAKTSEANAATSASNANNYMNTAKSWAIGDNDDGSRTDATDNEQSSLYYSNQAKQYRDEAQRIVGNVCTYDSTTGYIEEQFIPLITSQQISDLFLD